VLATKRGVRGYDISRGVQFFRTLFRPLFRLLFHILSHVEIQGVENVPERGAYLIAINHVSLYDPPFVLAFWPVAPEAAGAADIWHRPGQGLLVRLYGGIPVHRGEYDRRVLQKMIAVLQAGRPLLIAPEGGRSHTPGMRRGMPGVAYLIEKTGVPVVPVGVSGATDDFLTRAVRGERPTLTMKIGRPLHLPRVTGRGSVRREARQRNVDLIMTHIAALLPVGYRGVYAAVNENPPKAA